jgi:hypothetical protein
MPKFLFTQPEVIELLEKAVEKAGGERELAKAVGCHQRQIEHLRKGRRAPRGKVLAYLGFAHMVGYYRVSP